MTTRAETAAATRVALIDAARVLLDLGGPDAVTLREVGARAGVSRSAPYRHFRDKESLLTLLATESWDAVGDSVQNLAADPTLAPADALRGALLALVSVGRSHPHLYRLMFTTPSGDPTAVVRAAGRTQDLFLSIVARVVGKKASLRYGALLLTSAHGIIGLELSGHLVWDKWHATAEELIDELIALLPTA
ncbi:MAG TPA: TetR/AcrR family transcriptional regulator [Microbacteriaceae bacterium]